MVLLLKLFLAPVLVVASTLAGRRWGAAVAGVLVALPIVAGPILFIAHQQHGADFTAAAARASLLGLASLAVFSVVFARLARRCGWAATVALSWTTVLAADAALSLLPDSLPVAVAATVCATSLALALVPRTAGPTGAAARTPPRWDLPARAVSTAVLVLAVTTASGALGPHWTGLLAPFPSAVTVVVAFVHAQHGPDSVARTLRGALLGLYGFAVFGLVVAVLVRPVGGGAFAVAFAAAVAVALLTVRADRSLGRAQAS